MRAPRGATAAAATLILAVASIACAAGPAAAQKAPAKTRAAAKAVPDSLRVLVRVGTRTITRADVDRRLTEIPEQFRQQYSTPDGRRQLLERMVDEGVWFQHALQHGVADRPQVKHQLDQQRRDLIIRTYLTERMAASPAPSDSDAQVFYEAHLDDYRTPATVTLSHILSKSQDQAKKVKMWATAGQDWKKLVERFSVDTLTRAKGGQLGTVTRDGVFSSMGPQPALAESAFAVGAGGIGGPYPVAKGWSVIKVEAVSEGGARPFDQVRPAIVRQLSTQRSQDYYRELLEKAREELNVRPDSAAIRDYLSAKKSAREMFDEAQQAGTPAARLEGFERLIAAYPDDPLGAQARFMIGFIYSDELKDYDRAEQAFRELLRRDPKSELAPSAQWMLEHMRSTDVPAFDSPAEDSLAPAGSASKAEGRSSKP